MIFCVCNNIANQAAKADIRNLLLLLDLVKFATIRKSPQN